MKSGDIVFVRGNSLISKLIRLFDKGSFSHVAICLTENIVLEAQYFTTSRTVPFYFTDYEIVDLNLSDSQRERIQDLGLNLVGRIYDYKLILSYFLRRVWNKKIKIYNSPNNYICSELVEILLQDVGAIPKDEQLRDMTPNELYRYLRQGR
jgi:hypothetical protein